MPSFRFLFVVLGGAIGAAGLAVAAEAPKKESPPPSAGLALAKAKGPPVPAAAAAPAATEPLGPLDDERYELRAITVVDKTTVLVGDYEEKTARWIGVGDKFGDLELVSV